MELAKLALNSALSKLRELLISEFKLQKGVRGEIMFLEAEMEGIQAVLNKVSNLPAHQIDDIIKIWVRDLRELSYDMEDSINKFKVRIDAPTTSTKPHIFKGFIDRVVGLFTRAKNRHHISDDIGDIKRRIREVNERKDRYRLDGIVAKPDLITVDPRLPGIYEEVTKLVGIDGRTKELTDLLGPWDDGVQQPLKVVSVVGMGGLGKTTTARLVHERLRGQFECQAFVSVSLRPNMMQIFASILRQVSKNKCTNAGEQKPEELIDNIRGLLENRRYFIVIDDVWSEGAWKRVKCALIDNDLGSKVIVTTRHVDVAKLSSTHGTIYELDPLSNVDSKKLFYRRVFNVEDGIHSEFVDISMKILKKCGGIPLAIITTASLLAGKSYKTKNEWYSVYYSMGSGLEKNETVDNMRDILCLSYNDLPSYLKPCLLYLSIFPEDADIPRDVLVRLWIAEGFIDEKQGNTLHEIGESYFNELVNRSMIQVVSISEDVDYDSIGCCVHDMVLALISSIAIEENFLTISEGSNLISQVGKIRRLGLQSNEKHKHNKQPGLVEAMDVSHVRTIISRYDNPLEWIPPLSKFEVLRILFGANLSCGKSCPKDLGSLHHLRYLSIEGDPKIEALEQIGNLKFLKTLDIRGACMIRELPASITRLSQLEHLLMYSTGVKLPDGIGHLTSLQELSWLCVDKSPNSLAELGKLTELRVLRISGIQDDDDEKTFLQALSNLGNIHTLSYDPPVWRGLSLDSMPDGWRAPAHLRSIHGFFSRLPPWFSSLSELCSLSISVEKLKQDDFCLLGALPMLRSLQLRQFGATEHQLRATERYYQELHVPSTIEDLFVIGTDQPFPSLAEFEFRHHHRCWLVFAQGVMPKLQMLQLDFVVPKREGGRFDDIGLENLTSLEHITVKLRYDDESRRNEVEGAKTKVADAIRIHPKRPTLKLFRQRHGLEDSLTDQELFDGSDSEAEDFTTYDANDNDSETSDRRVRPRLS